MAYVAYLHGHEYEAALTQDPNVVDLYSEGESPSDERFTELAPGIRTRSVRLDELDVLYNVEWYCEYKGHPFIVDTDLGDRLAVQYVGGDISVAESLGLKIQEPLVATGVFPRDQVDNLREVRRQIWPRENGS
ncbi:hypothetical protein [Kutzneria kofuensis]|uniref:Uncharacterized protein n=1 Tax=Kutzneria kofuensis TaxID=103725 RepID=A0A7W9NHR6_9PSEU|nr:hypothetical protein [Kutzneria kofuensis]MBB5892403.1 hypothetical protein [Kutzneria kofuensis]